MAKFSTKTPTIMPAISPSHSLLALATLVSAVQVGSWTNWSPRWSRQVRKAKSLTFLHSNFANVYEPLVLSIVNIHVSSIWCQNHASASNIFYLLAPYNTTLMYERFYAWLFLTDNIAPAVSIKNLTTQTNLSVILCSGPDPLFNNDVFEWYFFPLVSIPWWRYCHCPLSFIKEEYLRQSKTFELP